MRSRHGVGTAVLGAVVCGVLLTGCSGDDGGENEEPAGAIPDQGQPLETLGEDGLPADYPRQEVPLVDGEVTSVKDGGSKDPGYAVAIVTDASVESSTAKAVKLLEGAGWREASGSGSVHVLQKGADQVIITSVSTAGHALISYSIDLAS